ncbi:MAG: PEP-CTERM sorting domain-containing protein [Pirellulales bacterium]|nr:PEP-CTERM sorting domain-containing protein [Pirellulales bacterium]
MKLTKIVSTFALTALLALCAQPALATPTPVTLTLTPASVLTLTVAALGSVTGTTTTTLTGTQGITLDDGVPTATSMTLDGGNINLSDASLFLNLGFLLGGVNAGIKNGHLTGLVSTGSVPLNYTAGTWNYTFDPGDPSGGNLTSAGIDNGILTYNGTGIIGSLLGSGTLDFSTSPANFDLPPLGQVATLTQTLLGSSGVSTTYKITMSAPINVAQSVLTAPVQVDATLVGGIVATGTYVVAPEPSTIVLLGIALAGLVAMRRKIRR